MSRLGDQMRRGLSDYRQGEWAPDPGDHTAVVVDAELRFSKAGDPIGALTLELLGANEAGQRWDQVLFWTSERAVAMAVEQLSIYGVPDHAIEQVETDADLARLLDGLVGVEVDVSCTAKTDGDGVWTRAYASRRNGVGEVPAEPPPQPSADPDDDDIPF